MKIIKYMDPNPPAPDQVKFEVSLIVRSFVSEKNTRLVGEVTESGEVCSWKVSKEHDKGGLTHLASGRSNTADGAVRYIEEFIRLNAIKGAGGEK